MEKQSKISSFISYFDPFNSYQHFAKEKFNKLSVFNKILTVVCTTFATLAGLPFALVGGLLTGTAAFRKIVELLPEANATVKKTNAAATTILSPRDQPAVQPTDAATSKLILEAITRTPQFTRYLINYKISEDKTSSFPLTGISIRPANLFLEKLLGPLGNGKPISTLNQFGNAPLFEFVPPHDVIAKFIAEKAQTDDFVEFSSKDQALLESRGIKSFTELFKNVDLTKVYGTNVYRISYKEIQQTLDSQKIFVAELLPLQFYQELKKAMTADNVITLPGSDRNPMLLNEFENSANHPNIAQLMRKVKANPTDFGFKDTAHFNKLNGLTLYQMGSLVVKSEDFHIFMDDKGKIIERNVGDKNVGRLINACGIRGLGSDKTSSEHNKEIMTSAFLTSLAAAESGIVLFLAVGMGVWQGDPGLYWEALLDAIVLSPNSFDSIIINPNHEETHEKWKQYAGSKGEEFAPILQSKIDFYTQQGDLNAVAKLKKIKNISKENTDLVHLQRGLLQRFPEKIVSLFNASDPDVTLGYHVGEYTTRIPHTKTTEENYSALSFMLLCNEYITRIHTNAKRLFQVSNNKGKAI